MKPARLIRRAWGRLPLDGAGCVSLGSPGQRIIQQAAARAFWTRVPGRYRPPARLAARLLWFLACPVKAALESGKARARPADLWAAIRDGLVSGKAPQDTLLQRSMAGGDRTRLRIIRDVPGDRQGMLALLALGEKSDRDLAQDKLAMAERLGELGFPVPPTRAVVAAGQAPMASGRPWNGEEKLLVKPLRGAASHGMFSVQPLGGGWFSIDRGTPVDRSELERRLRLGARRDSLIVQPYIGPSADTLDLSPDAPSVVRVSMLRAAPGSEAFVASASLKILAPGGDVPHGTRDFLRAHITPGEGLLEEGFSFREPGKRWPRVPWNGAPLSGRRLAQWPAVREMAIRASETLPGLPVIG